MNSLLNLGRCLGDVSTSAFQRHYQHQLVQSLEQCENVKFRYAAPTAQIEASVGQRLKPSLPKQTPVAVAHQSGTNCLTIDPQTSRLLVTGGADSTVRLWDLESQGLGLSGASCTYEPAASLTRSDPQAHTHALTSISIYPFDPSPTTLISTSYDKSILLSAVTPASLRAVHKSPLDFTPHVHAISPHPGSSPLVAIGTTHPAIRLLDLRTGLSTHSLPGHNGAVYALSFLPASQNSHVLVSGAVDGRILLFDIRRANPAFASLDLDDAVGFQASSFSDPLETRQPHLHLNFNARAHAGPVTGLVVSPSGQHLVSAGHDSRIRVWDLTTGRNELVHFGPRIRNSRNGNLQPLMLPVGVGKPSGEVIIWPNDDGRGELFVQKLREGSVENILRTKGVDRAKPVNKGVSPGEITNVGRINALALRHGGADTAARDGLELYSAHGDGSVCVWKPMQKNDDDELVDNANGAYEADTLPDSRAPESSTEPRVREVQQAQKKRKRDLIGDLVHDLTQRRVAFS